jgi:hypothetical protein
LKGGSKVSGQNFRSFFGGLWESAKVLEHWIRIRIFERPENKVWPEAVELTDPETENLIVSRLKLIACCFSAIFLISIVKTPSTP